MFLSDSIALDASWIGPPNLRNSLVRLRGGAGGVFWWLHAHGTRRVCGFSARAHSSTVYVTWESESSSWFASASPPTPAPAIRTCRGFSAEISSFCTCGDVATICGIALRMAGAAPSRTAFTVLATKSSDIDARAAMLTTDAKCPSKTQ